MRMLYSLVSVPLLLLFVLSGTVTVEAAGGRVTIESGQEVLLHYFGRFDSRTCRSRPVTVKIVKRPDHGKLYSKNLSIDPADGYTNGFFANRCNGTRIPTEGYYYRAPKNFRGKVHIILRPVGWMGGRNQHYHVTVK